VHGLLAKYQKQNRLTARVELKKLDYDAAHRRVHPNLSVDTGPKVEVKAVEAKLSKRVIKRYVPVFEENTVDNDLLVEGKRNLHDYLQSQGYYDVDVDFRVLPPQNDLEVIEYVISRGQRYKLVRVMITGNKYFDEEDIRERMFMQPASFRVRRGRYSEAFRRKDEENIGNLYRANGFRDVKVTTIVDRNYQNNAGDIAVTVKIEEGPQWFVESLAMHGVNQVKRQQIEIEADLRDLVPNFLEHKRADLGTLRTAIDHKDYETISQIGHKMKGEGGSFGFDAVTAMGSVLEQAALNQDLTSANHTLDQLAEYLESIDVVYT